MAEFEKLYGYLIDENGRHDPPITITNEADASSFIKDNVEKHHELMLTDMDDNAIFHAVDRTLKYPIPPHGDTSNKWSTEHQRFVTV